MTKAIVILVVLLALAVGWKIFLYYDELSHDEYVAKKEAAAAVITSGEQLSGLPYQLEPSFKTAQNGGVNAMRAWLKANGPKVQEPRKTWIELDFCVALARESPGEARKLFAEIKQRTQPSSPVWPRIKSLEKTYE
jgi:hypothetical protein